MKANRIFLAALGCLCLVTAALRAQVPQLLNYQGRVAVGTVNFNGTGQFKFALVNAAGTTTYWRNSPDTSPADGVPDSAVSLTVTKGLYSILLGDTSITNMAAIPASAWANADVRLRVWFNDGTNGSQLLTPDQRLAPATYLADGSVTGAAIASQAITTSKIAPNAINGSLLAPGSLSFSHLTVPVSPTVGQVLGFNGTGLTWTAPGGGVFTLNGTNAYYNGGNVGIGTTNPGGALEVQSPDVTTALFVRNLGGGGGTQPALRARVDAFSGARNIIQAEHALGTAFLVRDDGRVGIGTTNPEEKLHFFGNLLLEQTMGSSAFDRPTQIVIRNDSQKRLGLGLFDNGIGVLQPYEISVGYHDLLINPSGGNVGIGTLAPTQKLTVAGSIGLTGQGAIVFADGSSVRSATEFSIPVQVAVTTSGQWTAPAGVYRIRFRILGGGGGGSNRTAGGGGGGGGAFAQFVVTNPVAGEVFNLTVGAGGAINAAGGQSAVVRNGTTLAAANGGGAGVNATGGAGGTVGTGQVGDNGENGEAWNSVNDEYGYGGAPGSFDGFEPGLYGYGGDGRDPDFPSPAQPGEPGYILIEY